MFTAHLQVRAGTSAEVEAFVHGALCVSYSGQCFSSEAWGGRSANRWVQLWVMYARAEHNMVKPCRGQPPAVAGSAGCLACPIMPLSRWHKGAKHFPLYLEGLDVVDHPE